MYPVLANEMLANVPRATVLSIPVWFGLAWFGFCSAIHSKMTILWVAAGPVSIRDTWRRPECLWGLEQKSVMSSFVPLKPTHKSVSEK